VNIEKSIILSNVSKGQFETAEKVLLLKKCKRCYAGFKNCFL